MFPPNLLVSVLFLSAFTAKMQETAPLKKPLNRSNSSADMYMYDRNEGSISDSAAETNLQEGKKRRASIGYKMASLVGLSKKSNSTSNLAGRSLWYYYSTDNKSSYNKQHWLCSYTYVSKRTFSIFLQGVWDYDWITRPTCVYSLNFTSAIKNKFTWSAATYSTYYIVVWIADSLRAYEGRCRSA